MTENLVIVNGASSMHKLMIRDTSLSHLPLRLPAGTIDFNKKEMEYLKKKYRA